MKKMLPALIAWTLSASLYALPLGNPWEASLHSEGVIWQGTFLNSSDPSLNDSKAWNLRLGFYGDFVFNRHMQLEHHTKKSIRRTEIFTEAGYLALNVWKRVDIFGTLGASKVYFTSPDVAFDPANTITNEDTDLLTKTDFSWSIGLRGTLWEWGCLGIGAEAQFFRTRPRINYTHANDNPIRYAPSGAVLKYEEWQIGLGAAYRINIIDDSTAFVPYAGVKWSHARIDNGNLIASPPPDTFFNLKTQRHWGYSLGVTFIGCNKISVTAEGCFANESAFYVNSQFRF